MKEFKCAADDKDLLVVADVFDGDNELEVGIDAHWEDYANIFLTKSDAKKLAEHILKVLEESE